MVDLSFEEITCDDPDVTENVVVDAGTRSVGTVAQFSCTKGRYLVGNGTRVCLKHGQWSGKSPICKPVDCERPPPIEFGRVIVVNDSTVYGANAEYHCVPNYQRIGPYLRKCMETGKWSGEEPRCEREYLTQRKSFLFAPKLTKFLIFSCHKRSSRVNRPRNGNSNWSSHYCDPPGDHRSGGSA